ncbi:TetR/AcrR family transcriptional regulator [Thalassiella azotivora]
MQQATDDLTARARIRNAALRLLAERGESTSLREVAREAGVTPGLVVHHFGSRDGLRTAVEDHVIDLFRQTLDAVPLEGSASQVGAARDAAMADLLRGDPALMGYVRRLVMAPGPGDDRLVERVVGLSLDQVRSLRAHGVTKVGVSEQHQAVAMLVRQLGYLLLEPVVERMWAEAVGPDGDPPPPVEVRLRR